MSRNRRPTLSKSHSANRYLPVDLIAQCCPRLYSHFTHAGGGAKCLSWNRQRQILSLRSDFPSKNPKRYSARLSSVSLLCSLTALSMRRRSLHDLDCKDVA